MMVSVDQVFATNHSRPAQSHRRIIGIFGCFIYYSDGGDTNKSCLLHSFKVWVLRNNAACVLR